MEAQRELAMTIITEDVQLLLVARSGSIKEKVSALSRLVGYSAYYATGCLVLIIRTN